MGRDFVTYRQRGRGRAADDWFVAAVCDMMIAEALKMPVCRHCALVALAGVLSGSAFASAIHIRITEEPSGVAVPNASGQLFKTETAVSEAEAESYSRSRRFACSAKRGLQNGGQWTVSMQGVGRCQFCGSEALFARELRGCASQRALSVCRQGSAC